MKSHEKREITLIFLALAIIFTSVLIAFILQGELTGNVTGRAGPLIYEKDDTPDNITVEAGSINLIELSIKIFPYWNAFYGNLTNNRSRDGISLRTNITFYAPYKDLGIATCEKTEIYATPSLAHLLTNFDVTLPSESYMNSLTPAN